MGHCMTVLARYPPSPQRPRGVGGQVRHRRHRHHTATRSRHYVLDMFDHFAYKGGRELIPTLPGDSSGDSPPADRQSGNGCPAPHAVHAADGPVQRPRGPDGAGQVWPASAPPGHSAPHPGRSRNPGKSKQARVGRTTKARSPLAGEGWGEGSRKHGGGGPAPPPTPSHKGRGLHPRQPNARLTQSRLKTPAANAAAASTRARVPPGRSGPPRAIARPKTVSPKPAPWRAYIIPI